MYNSDGYILIDMAGVDITQSTQYLSGIYNRIEKEVTKINKLAVVINAGELTPMACVVVKTLNYYVITTSLYIFKVNTNDIVIIEEAGEVTVDVSIVPTLLTGTKIADFAIGSTEGSLYAPTQQSEINDTVPSDHTTFSSDKINTLLNGKANSSDLATVATTGSYTDLTNKPTIPTKVSELQNDSGYVPGSSLATVATTGSYDDLINKPTIPTKVSELQNDSGYITDSALSSYQTKTDNTLSTTDKTVVGAINELKANIDYNSYNAVNWGTYRGSLSITGGQWNTISNGTVRDVNSFTSKTDNKITLPDDSLYIVFANVSTNDGSGLVGLIATDNNTELATFLYNKISGQANKYMGYWVVAGAQNKEISLKVFAQGTGVTAMVEIDIIRVSLSRDS